MRPPESSDAPKLGKNTSAELVKTRSLERTTSGASDLPCLAPFGLLEPPQSCPPSPSKANSGLAPEGLNASLLPMHALDDEPFEDAPPSWWRRLLAFTGPGWLMSIAYVDPGNLEADLQCGAQYGYILLWVTLWASLVGLMLQMVAARIGCATRRHLAEHCFDQYEKKTRVGLWLFTELAIIGSDIQEVIGCSIGLQLLFGIPLPTGVVMTAFAAFGFLFLERFGIRPLELFFGVLILVLALSMGGLFVAIAPDSDAVLEGLLVPKLPRSAMSQAVGMVGCIIMPHNLFLHSALVQSRVVAPGDERDAIRMFTIESTAAILTSVLINTCVVAIFAKGFYGASSADQIGLKNAGDFLGNQYGDAFKIIWGVGLVAAGQSSTMTGAYAGQWVMQGYLQLKVKPWLRAIITRSMALVPCLSVAMYFGGEAQGLDTLNSFLNVLQSLVLPFAAVPLLRIGGSGVIMGDLALTPVTKIATWTATALIMCANVYLFVEQFGDSPTTLLGIGVYIAAVCYVGYAARLVAPGAPSPPPPNPIIPGRA